MPSKEPPSLHLRVLVGIARVLPLAAAALAFMLIGSDAESADLSRASPPSTRTVEAFVRQDVIVIDRIVTPAPLVDDGCIRCRPVRATMHQRRAKERHWSRATVTAPCAAVACGRR